VRVFIDHVLALHSVEHTFKNGVCERAASIFRLVVTKLLTNVEIKRDFTVQQRHPQQNDRVEGDGGDAALCKVLAIILIDNDLLLEAMLPTRRLVPLQMTLFSATVGVFRHLVIAAVLVMDELELFHVDE
jgi:hypothetical protein